MSKTPQSLIEYNIIAHEMLNGQAIPPNGNVMFTKSGSNPDEA